MSGDWTSDMPEVDMSPNAKVSPVQQRTVTAHAMQRYSRVTATAHNKTANRMGLQRHE